jgi:hypothetical protein
MALVDAASSILDSREEETTLVSKSTPFTESDAAKHASPLNVDLDKKGSFVEELMGLLDDDTYSNVVTWMPDGKAFTIVNPKRFTSVEMPAVFNIRNMSSFVRKLTRWGFTRAHDKATMNSDIFMHKDFQRGNREAMSQIKCSVGRPGSTTPSRPRVPPAAVIAAKPSLAPVRPPVPSAVPPPQPTSHQGLGVSPQTVAPSARASSPPAPPMLVVPPLPRRHDGLLRTVSLNEDRSVNLVEDIRQLLRTSDGPRSGMTVCGSPTGHATGLGATIESLLRERESLLKGADANAMALVRLLREHERMRMNELRAPHPYFPSAGVGPALPPSPPSRNELPSYLEHHHHASSVRGLSGYRGVRHVPRF